MVMDQSRGERWTAAVAVVEEESWCVMGVHGSRAVAVDCSRCDSGSVAVVPRMCSSGAAP